MRLGVRVICAVAVAATSLACAGNSSQVVTGGPFTEALLQCDCEVILPRDWTVMRVESGSGVGPRNSCEVGLRPQTWDDIVEQSAYSVSAHAIYIAVFPGSVSDATLPTRLVEREGDTLWIRGRQGIRTRAQAVTSASWKGWRGASLTGLHYKGGGYAGLCDGFVALIDSGAGQLALIVASTAMRDEELFDGLIQSFRFRNKDG